MKEWEKKTRSSAATDSRHSHSIEEEGVKSVQQTDNARRMGRMIPFSSFFIAATSLIMIAVFIQETSESVQEDKHSKRSHCKIRSTDGKLVCLPDVFFIGASKAGTSTVATILYQHPMISNPRDENKDRRRQDHKDKESHYFDHLDGAMHTNNHVFNRINKHGGIIGINTPILIFYLSYSTYASSMPLLTH